MKTATEYCPQVFKNPISGSDLHKIYNGIEMAQKEAYNECITDVLKIIVPLTTNEMDLNHYAKIKEEIKQLIKK
jgi:hypothetical protein